MKTPTKGGEIFDLITRDITLAVVEQLLSVLRVLSATGKFNHLMISQMKKLPQYFSALPINSAKKKFPVTGAALRDMFWLEKKMPQDVTWVSSELAHRLLLTCRQYLQERANNQPQPPADWVRPAPSSVVHKTHWQLLKAFLESPDEKVFDYRKNQSERNELEIAIRSVVIDLETETIKKGSPHTLRITKTQTAYHREKKSWKEDLELLSKIIRKIEG